MGRVTIFSLKSCPHCLRCKNAFKQRDIPYTEISLSTHPRKRSDMISLADRLTVPQVFFNDEHIGGADETIKLLLQWDGDEFYSSPLLKYEGDVESKDDSSDERLAAPTEPPVEDKPPPPRNLDDSILIPPSAKNGGGTNESVLKITQTLLSAMPSKTLSHMSKKYSKCCTGGEAVDAVKKQYGFEDRSEAEDFCKYLQKRKIVRHVVSDEDNEFRDTPDLYFHLQPHAFPKTVNSYRVWTDRVDPDPQSLIFRLKKLLGNITSNATNDEGEIDYIACAQDPKYPQFEEEVCELQGVDFRAMPDKTKLAFGINVYNTMIAYSFIKVGIPKSSLQRMGFFSGVKFDIGGFRFTFSEFENGVLRGNRKPPSAVVATHTFDAGDARSELAVKEVDSRLHFALNCGAKSCPPVKKFTVEAIDEELRLVAMAFCEGDENVSLKEDKGKVKMSMIFKWYSEDFEPMGDKLVDYLRGDKKKKFEEMLAKSKSDKNDIKWSYFEYDWGTNDSKSLAFVSKDLRANESRFRMGLF